ncbi:MAG TPA: methylated-DNA--[protein]-cysteine S-methyltransferase [Thermoanaerobaculia bacterium]|nr:methylated-DNA--[protein]-cysteine S-methyltransferase [Thermoanaerobaculia bacterium]
MTIFTILESPIGPLSVGREKRGGAITDIHFFARTKDEWQRDDDAFGDVATQLREYFGGTRREFELPLAPAGTEFQRNVWSVLRTIPYGRTWSYLDVANAIRKPSACRAVGAANGANPLPIVVPCHRVIGTNGSLTGFGGGIDVKKRLLALEGGAPLSLFDT